MKASSSITISHITDGLTTHYQYAKNESNITAPSVGWSPKVPASEVGKFIWRREGHALAGETPSTWSTPICLTGSKGDPGAAGAVGQGVESIIEEYYLSTSKTERIGGSWVTDPPTWSTGKYMWTRSKITYKNPTDTEYTTPVCDSSWEAVNLTEDELKKYIQSRGENLITNGSGLLGSNYNFSAFTYDGSEAYYSNGSFRYYGSGTTFTDEFMPVNPELAYKLSMFAKTANGVGRYYAMVACFDVDNKSISAQHHMYRANTLTTLSQELKNGDTVVHLTDASNWYNDGTAGVNTHLRSIILWNYKNSYGYLYPPQTYSRNWIGNAWNPGAINFENNTITLISPWAGGTVEAGTPLSNGSSGSTYKYRAMSNTIIPTTWTEYAGVISGIDLSGSNVSDKFSPGTAKVKIGWLLNYQGSGETIWIANIAFNIHLATQSELDSTKLIVNSSVKSTDVEYYLSTSSTSLSGGSWQTTAPAWVDGKFMWSRTRVELNNGTVRYTPSESGTCIAGATGAKGDPGTPGKGVVSVVTEYALSDSNTDVGVDPDWDTTPPERGAGEYLWTRQIITYTDSTFTITEPICVTGDKGPSGNPGALGVNIDGTTLEVAGYDDDGEFGASTGRVYLGSSFYTLEQTLYTVTENGNGYILGSASGLVRFAKIEPLTDSGASRVAWMEFNSGEEIVGDVVIGEFKVENGVIVEANILPTMTLDQFINSNFIKLLRTAPNENSTRLLAMAMGVDTVFQSIVAMEAFIRELWVYKMQSEAYSEDALGNPLSGFKFDGETGEGKITNLKARDADVSGKLASDGFKTLEVVAGITRPIYTVPSTIYKRSEMEALINNQDKFQTISGNIDGYEFGIAVRRNDKRILLNAKYDDSATINGIWEGGASSAELNNVNLVYDGFGNFRFVEWHIHYSGNLTHRELRRKYYPVPYGSPVDIKTVWDGSSGNHSKMVEWGVGSPKSVYVYVKSTALWGSVKATSEYVKTWTPNPYNGIVLKPSISSYSMKVIPFEPNAYYLSASNPFTIGSTNQDTGSIKKYKSGTDLYNHFSTVPSGKDIACTGKINVNGTIHTVTRLRREANRMVFYAGQEVAVHKFTDGGSLGVYTELAVTQQFVIGATTGGIEAMSILPWANALYDIGEVARKFRSLYISGEVNANTGVFAGALSAGGDIIATGKLSGATVNTGYGDNKVHKITRERFCSYSSLTTVTISSMSEGEIRFVNAGANCRVNLPSGGSYLFVGGVDSKGSIWFQRGAGGESIFLTYSSTHSGGGVIVWRI